MQSAAALRARILYKDEHFIALNKAAGVPVQGGTNIRGHLDGMLDLLRFDSDERPRLVHRLDRDTTGVLLLARSRHSAQHCATVFRNGLADKTYWAIVSGVPRPRRGQVRGTLRKAVIAGEHRIVAGTNGRDALTDYRTRASSDSLSWLELSPRTGRTHQLRVHCALIGCPICGDPKYGERSPASSMPLQLHARELAIPDMEGLTLRITAPLPDAMRDQFERAGFPLPDDRLG